MRGNFGPLKPDISVWEYAEIIGEAHKKINNKNKNLLKIFLKYLNLSRKNQKWENCKIETGYKTYITVVIFEKYLINNKTPDYLGLSISKNGNDDHYTLKFGIGHIYKDLWRSYFSTSEDIKLNIDEDIINKLLNGKLNDKEKDLLDREIQKFRESIEKFILNNEKIKNNLKKDFLGKEIDINNNQSLSFN